MIKNFLEIENVTFEAGNKSKVNNVSLSIENEGDQLVFSGQAEANIWLNIYLYSSLPLVMLTKTDASGNWSYAIKKSEGNRVGSNRSYRCRSSLSRQYEIPA